MTIDGISVDDYSVIRAIKYFCDKTTDEKGRSIPRKATSIYTVERNLLYEYLILFAIRVETCNTALPDDIIGGLRFMPKKWGTGGYWDIIFANASTDPSPLYLTPPVAKQYGRCPTIKLTQPNGIEKSYQTEPCKTDIWYGNGPNPFENKCCILYDDQARAEGGAAWIAPGQYTYFYKTDNFKGAPAFAPLYPLTAYRWAPSYEGEKFNPNKVIKEYNNSSTYIHRTWFKERLFYDSAGCQVIPDDDTLNTLAKWAKNHKKQGYPNSFQYTLMTKQDFVTANRFKFKLKFSLYEDDNLKL